MSFLGERVMHFDRNSQSAAGAAGLRAGPSASVGRLLIWGAALLFLGSGTLQATELQEIRTAAAGPGQTQISLRFSEAPPEARIFSIDSPPRIALDLPDVSSVVARTTEVNQGPLLSITAVEAGDRTRVILNLAHNADYRSHVEGNQLILNVGSGAADVDRATPSTVAAPATPTADVTPAVTTTAPTASPSRAGVRSARPTEITDVDFRRGTGGEGRLVIELSRPGVTVDVKEQAGRVELTFPRVLMGAHLERRMDVTDFATPVNTIDTTADGEERVRMIVNASGDYDVLSYQMDRTYVLELAPLTETQREAQRLERQEFVGERLSLNFQDIEVRSVLQLLADFTDLNIVVSDTVTGNSTLRLNNVPWDQALDIILTSRGLDKRLNGNVMYVAPRQEIDARERRELEALRDRRDLEPLRTEFITVNFNQATNIQELVQTRRGDQERGVSFLSDRGSIAVDPRTNTLIIRDTQEQIDAIRRLVTTLDVPTRQVLIETRIVIADDSYRRELGARFGVSGRGSSGRTDTGLSGSLDGSSAIGTGQPNFQTGTLPNLGDRLNVALPAPGGSVGFSILRPDVLLELELSALQTEGRGEVIASPRVITANGQTARIQQGERIPFETTTDGDRQVEFEDALLLTEVTPQITPNGNVIMTIRVTKDEPDFSRLVLGQPLISKREVETQVSVANGETVVLGGVYEISSQTNLTKVPFFGDIPFLKHFFRNRTNVNNKAELLIFVTPRVLD